MKRQGCPCEACQKKNKQEDERIKEPKTPESVKQFYISLLKAKYPKNELRIY